MTDAEGHVQADLPILHGDRDALSPHLLRAVVQRRPMRHRSERLGTLLRVPPGGIESLIDDVRIEWCASDARLVTAPVRNRARRGDPRRPDRSRSGRRDRGGVRKSVPDRWRAGRRPGSKTAAEPPREDRDGGFDAGRVARRVVHHAHARLPSRGQIG
ncbi:hypothetical protein [Salinarimonas sp.]|uniref:hypothetical protein n=1 Tax=Salinarimonas sp. TaxID=2766526 RepID=UPI0032D9086A